MSAYFIETVDGQIRVKDTIYPPMPWLSITSRDGETVGVSLTAEEARRLAEILVAIVEPAARLRHGRQLGM